MTMFHRKPKNPVCGARGCEWSNPHMHGAFGGVVGVTTVTPAAYINLSVDQIKHGVQADNQPQEDPQLRKRLRICQGGARAGKTIAILMCLIDLAGNPATGKLVISVVSETMPHLKKGAMRDFMSIMESPWLLGADERWNKTDQHLHVRRRHHHRVLQCRLPRQGPRPRPRRALHQRVQQRAVRDLPSARPPYVASVIYLDFNPVAEFYVHTDLMHRADAEFIKLTYLDNEAIPPAIRREIELLKRQREPLAHLRPRRDRHQRGPGLHQLDHRPTG